MPIAYVLTRTEKSKVIDVRNEIFWIQAEGINTIESRDVSDELHHTVGPFGVIPSIYTTSSKVLLSDMSYVEKLNAILNKKGIKDALILTDSRN